MLFTVYPKKMSMSMSGKWAIDVAEVHVDVAFLAMFKDKSHMAAESLWQIFVGQWKHMDFFAICRWCAYQFLSNIGHLMPFSIAVLDYQKHPEANSLTGDTTGFTPLNLHEEGLDDLGRGLGNFWYIPMIYPQGCPLNPPIDFGG